MPTVTGKLRRRLLVPDDSEVTFDRRGFHSGDPMRQKHLEKTARQFLTGLRHGVENRSIQEMRSRLEEVERPYRGFAYEGAGMGVAVSDALAPWRRSRTRELLDGPGAPHVYMVYVGVGWAMARLPRPLWRGLALPDPLLRWLALDGYGFHEAYFATTRHVARHTPPRVRVPWADSSGYASRGVDQGIGRALWFVCGADVRRLADVVGDFPPARHADLWSGAGLAATYAGGVGDEDLALLVKLADRHGPSLAQGAAFAAKARVRADLVAPHTEAATRVLCGRTAAEAAAVTDEALEGLPPDGALPAFETWRERIRKALERT
ncbi:DUF1702 family protein [Streptomyces sedi]|uniref:DUF1702 family protein n=1 Tax=Streptomyces sedi TaxID=555059 RepID=A0A5C4VEH1_9ACTN|nr:DUF1702 family protein [Streptomyces sedi]TNM34320.1 DUF1702 family protein [Streptomyces sedi]